jgi:G3E family GTPase
MRLADVPAVVLTGLRGAGKTTLLGAMLRARPPAERIAVLLTERGEAAPPGLANATVVAAEPGCVCCVGQMSLRVALTRLLRETRPERVYIELAEPAHLARALATLRSPWLAPVLDIAEVDGVADATVMPRDAATAAWLRSLNRLHVRNDAAGAFATFARGVRPDLALG